MAEEQPSISPLPQRLCEKPSKCCIDCLQKGFFATLHTASRCARKKSGVRPCIYIWASFSTATIWSGPASSNEPLPNIDPAFALAIFWNESNFGRAGTASSTRSLGNLRCIPDAACWNGYAAFSSWQDGYTAFYKLISGPLYAGSGLTTPEAIIPKYAPSGDGNSPSHYISVVESAVSLWRQGKAEVLLDDYCFCRHV